MMRDRWWLCGSGWVMIRARGTRGAAQRPTRRGRAGLENIVDVEGGGGLLLKKGRADAV